MAHKSGRILISWIALNNDFKDGQVNTEGSPNYQFHKNFYNHDRHILLSSGREGDIRLDMLINRILRDFPKHVIEGIAMDIKDVIDLKEIKTKVENLLLLLSDKEVDIFFSPGTSIMQVSWYICHTSLKLNTRLVQTRSAFVSKSGKPEILYIEAEQSATPYTAILKQHISEKPQKSFEFTENYLITESLRPLYDKAYKIAQTDAVTTLILGDSGTGKEHLARFIHFNSARKALPFLAINCSAFTDSLLESRLFGHKKGAFTDAHADSAGIFAMAESGTVFLDEIGDISPYMQQSLLRVLQEKEFSPMGGSLQKMNVRIISATNKDLVGLCKEGRFRWDLYYRLAVAQLEIPALAVRGRTETAQLLDFFISAKKHELRKADILKLSDTARETLLSYAFPGNVRELENIIESLYVFCDEEVKPEDLPVRVTENDSEAPLSWKACERRHINKILNLCHGNQRRAWQILGYGSLNTLKKKLKEYDIIVNSVVR